MRYLARGLNSVFLPVIIYQTTQSLLLTMLYFLITSFTVLCFNLCCKRGLVQHFYTTMIFSVLAFIVLQVVLVMQQLPFIFYMFILAVLTGIDTVLTLSTLDYLFNKREQSEQPKQVRNTFFVEIIANAVAPIIGGCILTYFGLTVNVICSITITIISVIYLLVQYKQITINEAKIKETNPKQPLMNVQAQTSNIPVFPMVMGIFFVIMIGVFQRSILSWNIYLYMLEVKYTSIGILNGMIALGQLICAMFTYHMQKKQRSNIYLFVATCLIATCMTVRLFYTNLYFIYLTTICISLSYPMVYQPFKQAYIVSIKQKQHTSSIYFMEEFFKQFGCFLFSLVGFALFWLDVLGLQIMFIVGALAILISGIIYAVLFKKIKK